jgi:tartrate dehydrogenase/decarboxylase/D-malate dehydrogenase
MMLDHLGHAEAAAAIVGAIETILWEGSHTPDKEGRASTQELGAAIAAAV